MTAVAHALAAPGRPTEPVPRSPSVSADRPPSPGGSPGPTQANPAPRGLAAGAGRPARVALALPNTPDFVVGYLAALSAGLVAVPLNPGLTGPELRHALADSGAAVLICTEWVADLVAGLTAELPALAAVHTSPPAGAGQPGAGFPRRGGDDLAVLLYTSGTEGRPKGAMLPHRALAANQAQVARIDPPVVGPDDTVLLALPLFHAYGLNAGLGAVVHHGATGVLVDDLAPAAALAEIARHRVSVLVGVPSMFLGWSTADRDAATAAMAAVRVAVCGAAPLEPAVAARFTEVTGRALHVGYGLTETAPVLTSTLVGGVPKAGSIGRPLPGVELRLVDRLGELIIVNGFNVYPHEVEAVLAEHPGVAESAVLGVPHPWTGETVRAYVVPAPGRPATGEELLAHCARNLARFKCPTAVESVDALPYSAIGKVRKTQLRPAPSPVVPADIRTEVPDVQ
ncbi:AMP-binding protein [Micromonospora rubida]|uniref:AMP-binding protein n=1 Tax=Micromonospora rubida TaxID=2697657 RepID=UPI002E2A3566|nr:AMP-binding protein [Micromonospora rubida]